MVAQWLRYQNLVGGVLIDAKDEYEKIYALACIHEGLFFSGLPNDYDESELKTLGYNTVLTVNADRASTELNILLLGNSTIGSNDSVPNDFLPAGLSSDDLIRVVFSSGTTGRPKPTPFTLGLQSARVLAASRHYMKQSPFLTTVGFRTTAGSTCFFLDLFRGSLNLTPGSARHNLGLIHTYKVQGVMGSPVSLDAIRLQVEQSQGLSIELQEIVSAGSFIQPALAQKIAKTFSARVTNVYGSTEAGLIGYSDATEDPNDSLSLYPEVELRVVTPEGIDAGPDEPGKLLVKTPYMTSEYLDPKSSGSSAPTEYFEPGDIGILGSDHKLKIVGREDDMINLSGIKIDPRPIEEHAISLGGLTEAVSMLATNQHGKNFHMMFVVGPNPIETSELQKKLEGQFKIKSPQLVVQVPSIPKNEMGKVSRKAQIETSI